MQNWPAWIPYPTAWLSAVFLTLLTGGLGASAAFIWQIALWLSRISPRLGLLFGAIAILSPVILVAIAHHLVHLLMDRFFPDTQLPGMVAPPGAFPGLMSWWEGLYSWLVILVTTLVSFAILGVFPLSDRFLADILNWWEVARPFFRWSTLLWVVVAAYLYQFESLVQQRLIAVGKGQQG
ncbi:MAG: hypothetical protein ACFB8W_15140 [Elainellaceae cyanobacterium]